MRPTSSSRVSASSVASGRISNCGWIIFRLLRRARRLDLAVHRHRLPRLKLALQVGRIEPEALQRERPCPTVNSKSGTAAFASASTRALPQSRSPFRPASIHQDCAGAAGLRNEREGGRAGPLPSGCPSRQASPPRAVQRRAHTSPEYPGWAQSGCYRIERSWGPADNAEIVAPIDHAVKLLNELRRKMIWCIPSSSTIRPPAATEFAP